jgi:hypothetical protein
VKRFGNPPNLGAFEQLAPFMALIRDHGWEPLRATLRSYAEHLSTMPIQRLSDIRKHHRRMFPYGLKPANIANTRHSVACLVCRFVVSKRM